MDVNEDGQPIKDKMSKLTVVGKNSSNVLGEADLNLSSYTTDGDFRYLKL